MTDGFVAFALSSDVQKVAETNGFISLGIDKSSAAYVNDRARFRRLLGETPSASSLNLMQNLSERMDDDAVQLSVTFRFRTNSFELDNRALDDIKRLAAYARTAPGLASKLMLFGFADHAPMPTWNSRASARSGSPRPSLRRASPCRRHRCRDLVSSRRSPAATTMRAWRRTGGSRSGCAAEARPAGPPERG